MKAQIKIQILKSAVYLLFTETASPQYALLKPD